MLLGNAGVEKRLDRGMGEGGRRERERERERERNKDCSFGSVNLTASS